VSAAPHVPRVEPLSLAARLAGKAMALAYRLAGKHRYDDYRVERLRGLPFLVIPSVFNPKVPRTGAFLASHLDAAFIRGGDVLDMGTGSGVCAVFAARHARRVVAVDINEAAVLCAGINARLNRVAHKIDLRCGDLFAPLAGERFDLVLFNPPFVRGEPKDDRDRAWRSPDVAERFAAGLSAHLKPGGAALVLLSTYGDANAFLAELARHGFEVCVAAHRRFINERLTLFRVRPAA
jgi:release factor glutamine methyltransferase